MTMIKYNIVDRFILLKLLILLDILEILDALLGCLLAKAVGSGWIGI